MARSTREVIEGEWNRTLTVVVEFPPVESAKQWYDDDAYQEAGQVRIGT